MMNRLLWGQLLLILLISCAPEAPLRQSTLDSESTFTPPSYVDPSGQTLSTFSMGQYSNVKTLEYPVDLDDSFWIYGDQIDSYLQQIESPLDSNLCLLSRYPLAPNDLMLLSARVRGNFNFATNETTYSLQVYPNNKIQNTTECLNSTIVNKMTTLYPTSSLVYQASEVCPDGCGRLYGSSMGLYSESGNYIAQIDLSYLKLNIIPTPAQPAPTSTCSMDTTCTALGYQCCSANQCVNHEQVKSGVDKTSSEYLSAVEIIKASPNSIQNYSHLFYICNEYISPDEPVDTTDPNEENNELVTHLGDLYKCLNPYLDEISVCTVETKDASTVIDTVASTKFLVTPDDLNFTGINAALSASSIFNVEYGGVIIYQDPLYDSDVTVALPASIVINDSNDDLTTFANLDISSTLPTGSSEDNLKIRYKADGTCEKLSTNLAKCSKSYVQGQSSSPARPSDHTLGDDVFILPAYANLGYNVIVEVNGAKIIANTDTWSTAGNTIVFNSATHSIYKNQIVKITYFVTQDVTSLTNGREIAQSTINTYCSCGTGDCNLRPVYKTLGGITNIAHYECVYPSDDNQYIPLQQTVYVSAKSVPHRFYDDSGVSYDLNDIKTEYIQEGEVFEYTSNNSLRPNNQDGSKGFNEVYGTMNLNANSPKPPTVLEVKRGKSYDLFTDAGSFSSCVSCGTDFYSNLQRIFPDNFLHKGGGYNPNLVEARRQNNRSSYRADDLLFGRACFVPASMIPWSHTSQTTVELQRERRLATQHTLFANGYQRDWYGFDYGSLIGSFDGVKWFAIGNQRRIKAESNKLYVAVNAYYADKTTNNSFKVTVSEINPILYSGSSVNHDLDSDGAECQKAHICETDNDCLTTLGYEYACENITQIRTSWPNIDGNGNEKLGSFDTTISTLIGGSNGESKRCVYRGRGALCGEVSSTLDKTTTYSQTNQVMLNTCSSNNYCASTTTSVFNDRIARYANTARNQNSSSYVTDDTDVVGIGSRILGRPFEFYSTNAIDPDVLAQLTTNNATGMCVPGKAADNAFDIEDFNRLPPPRANSADKMFGIGATIEFSRLQGQHYYAACPAVDEDGNYITRHSETDMVLTNTNIEFVGPSQNLSTNAFNISGLETFNFYNDISGVKTALGYEQNACLRAPGASCFTDLDCAPSRNIATKFKAANIDPTDLNESEQGFWKQELVCSTSLQDRYNSASIPNADWDITENKCCMENGNEFTFKTQIDNVSDFRVYDNSTDTLLIPGVNVDINDPTRYSAINTVADKVGPAATRGEYPPLYSTEPQPATPILDFKLNQHNTLHLHNQRMCCTGHWVRNFSEGSNANSGGHKFVNTTAQRLDASDLKALSWTTLAIGDLVPFSCTIDDYDTPDCGIKNISPGSAYEKKWLDYLGKFELIGIPQVLIETNDSHFPDVDPDTQVANAAQVPLPGTIQDDVAVLGNGDADIEIAGTRYYSAASYENFDISSAGLKKIFSEDEFSCCLPTGIEVASDTTNSQCCSGQKNTSAKGVTQCCLNDFVDLTVYTNAYVSSEGVEYDGVNVSSSNIDSETGYINKDKVLQMAETMCCSGKAAVGIAINDYLKVIEDGQNVIQQAKTRRFLFHESLDDATEVGEGISTFRAGVKWNNHVYCVPTSFDSSTTAQE